MRKDKYARIVREIERDALWDVHCAQRAIELARDILRETKRQLDNVLRGEEYVRELQDRILVKTEQITNLEGKLERAKARLAEVRAR